MYVHMSMKLFPSFLRSIRVTIRLCLLFLSLVFLLLKILSFMICLGPLSFSVEPEKDHQLILGAAMRFPQVLLHLLITISVILTRITPLYVPLKTKGHLLRRALVDNGSLLNIVPLHTLDPLEVPRS